MNIVLIIPTGIGCEIGGHAGDANPVAKLLGKCCDNLILHPNVVNASDVNEMPDNAWYVDGYMLDNFLRGEFKLKKPKQNKILLVANDPLIPETINAVNSARVTIGIDIEVMALKTELIMKATMDHEGASGIVSGYKELVDQVSGHNFDALAIHSKIQVDRDVAYNYYKNGGINPWGGVEAKACSLISEHLLEIIPVAHAPIEYVFPEDKELLLIHEDYVMDPRISPEAISICYLHCILKGLNQAPRASKSINSISATDMDYLISPFDCWGTPHKLAMFNGTKIIMVRENGTCLHESPDPSCIIADNYLEVAGILQSANAGITPSSVRRPIKTVRIIK